MNPTEGANPNRQRHGCSYLSYRRIVIEVRQQLTRAGKRQGKNRSDAQFNPKEIARESIRKFLALHDQFHETIHTEAAKQEAKVVTMVTIPKSAGVSSRARMTTDPIITAKLPA